MSILVADIETDGLKPSVIWMVGCLDYETDEYTSYHGDTLVDGLLRISEADLCIGHNFIGYDVKHIERLTNGLVTFDRDKIIDTLHLSRQLVKLENHKLETWGDMFDFPKGDYKDFSRYSEAMDIYCERDVRLTKKVFELLNEIKQEQGQCLLEGLKRGN